MKKQVRFNDLAHYDVTYYLVFACVGWLGGRWLFGSDVLYH